MKARVITALIAIPITLFLIVYHNSIPLFGFLTYFTYLASVELKKMILHIAPKLQPQVSRITLLTPLVFIILAISLFIWGDTFLGNKLGGRESNMEMLDLIIAAWIFFIGGLIGIKMLIERRIGLISIILAPFWIIAPALLMSWTHAYFNAGPDCPCCLATEPGIFSFSPLLLAVIPVWVGDVAAIFVGKKYGRHPLFPTISPHKTVEGALGNLLACIGSALLLGWLLNVGTLISFLCGLFAGTFGQLGDLFESRLKRVAGVKDSGNFMPGHGGVLDRIDSLLFNIIPTCTLLILSLPPCYKNNLKSYPMKPRQGSHVSRETFLNSLSANNPVL